MLEENYFLLKKQNILIFLCCLCYLLAFSLQSNIFIVFVILILSAGFSKAFFHFFVIFTASLFLILVDFGNFKSFILLTFSIILLSVRFSKVIFDVLKIYSYVFLVFISCIILVSDPKYGSFQDIFSFQQRLWLILPDGREFNPNPLGLICALTAFGFLINRNYILMSVPIFFLLLTQSRAAILFFLILFIINQKIKIKNILISFILLAPFFYIIYTSPLMDRFSNDGENGRIERIIVYEEALRKNYILGYPMPSYEQMVAVHGTLDNMYLLTILNFGLIGVFFIGYLIFILFFNMKDDFFRLRAAIFIAFMVYGVFEGGVLSNYLTWTVFAMCFSGFDKKV